VPVDAVETAVPDVREAAAAEPAADPRTDEGRGRIASADDTAAAVARAQRALFELRSRAAAEQRYADEEIAIRRAQERARERDETQRAAEHADV
jgi:hypothetical protein